MKGKKKEKTSEEDKDDCNPLMTHESENELTKKKNSFLTEDEAVNSLIYKDGSYLEVPHSQENINLTPDTPMRTS